MIARDPEILLTDRFIISQVRKAFLLRAITNPLWKNAGEKERMISNVRANIKLVAIIRGLQRREHLKEIIQRRILPGNPATRALKIGIFRQQLRGVIRHVAIIDTRLLQHIADNHEKVKSIRNLQTAAIFDKRVK